MTLAAVLVFYAVYTVALVKFLLYLARPDWRRVRAPRVIDSRYDFPKGEWK